jgi:hypothetical protein
MYLSKKWAYRPNKSPERESLTLRYILLDKSLAKMGIGRVMALDLADISMATSGWLASAASVASDPRRAE